MVRTALLLTFVLLPSLAGAWTVLGEQLKGWQTRPLTLYFNPSGCPVSTSALTAVIDAAAAVWNASPTVGITIERSSDFSSTTPAQFLAGTSAQAAVILCDTTFSADNPGADPNFVPAATRLGSANPIAYGGILLNAEVGTSARIDNFSDAQLTVVLAHEIGHLLGLGHSSLSAALMYYSISGKTEAVLAQDDIDGLTYLYPSNEFSGNIFGCAAVHPPRESSRKIHWEMLAALFLGTLLARLGCLTFGRLLLPRGSSRASGFPRPSSK